MEIELVCKKGEVIFKEGDVSDNAYIIKTGQVEISKGEGKQKVVLAILKDGDIFGEMGTRSVVTLLLCFLISKKMR
mgnify:FL=1